jgi:hypothetical protein
VGLEAGADESEDLGEATLGGLNRAGVTELHAQVRCGASRVHERAVHP